MAEQHPVGSRVRTFSGLVAREGAEGEAMRAQGLAVLHLLACPGLALSGIGAVREVATTA